MGMNIPEDLLEKWLDGSCLDGSLAVSLTQEKDQQLVFFRSWIYIHLSRMGRRSFVWVFSLCKKTTTTDLLPVIHEFNVNVVKSLWALITGRFNINKQALLIFKHLVTVIVNWIVRIVLSTARSDVVFSFQRVTLWCSAEWFWENQIPLVWPSVDPGRSILMPSPESLWYMPWISYRELFIFCVGLNRMGGKYHVFCRRKPCAIILGLVKGWS